MMPKSHDIVSIVGHPLQFKKQHTVSGIFVESNSKNLSDLVVDPTSRNELVDRKSPSLDSKILSLVGYILPGHSGAPILNQVGQVVGIGNGGLKSGTVGIGWGMPIQEINPVSRLTGNTGTVE
jgi:S1-C subfamily serine protease